MALITFHDLAPWVQFTVAELEQDPLASKVIDRASLLVNDAARQQWDIEDPDNQPPGVAASIAEALAARTFSNPRVVQQRATGPMSERLADVVLTGMALREDEIERLAEYRDDHQASEGARVWVQETIPPEVEETYAVPYEMAYNVGVHSWLVPYSHGYPGDHRA